MPWHTKWYLNISKHFTIQLGFTVIVTMNLLTITNEVLKIKNVSIKCVRILDIVPVVHEMVRGRAEAAEAKEREFAEEEALLKAMQRGELPQGDA